MKSRSRTAVVSVALAFTCACRVPLDVGGRGDASVDGGVDMTVADSATTDAEVDASDDATRADVAVPDVGTDVAVPVDASADGAVGPDANDACAVGCIEWPASWTTVFEQTFAGGAAPGAYTANGACGSQGPRTVGADDVWTQTSDWNHLRFTQPAWDGQRPRAFEARLRVLSANTAGATLGFRNTAQAWNTVYHDGYAFEFTVLPTTMDTVFNVGGSGRSRATFPAALDTFHTVRVEEHPGLGTYRLFVDGTQRVEGPLTDLLMAGDLVALHSTGTCSAPHVDLDSVRVELGCPGSGCP